MTEAAEEIGRGNFSLQCPDTFLCASDTFYKTRLNKNASDNRLLFSRRKSTKMDISKIDFIRTLMTVKLLFYFLRQSLVQFSLNPAASLRPLELQRTTDLESQPGKYTDLRIPRCATVSSTNSKYETFWILKLEEKNS